MCSVCGRVQYYHTVLVKQPQLNHIVVRMVCVVPCNTRFLVIRLFRTHKFSFSSAAAVWRRHSRTNISYWTHTHKYAISSSHIDFMVQCAIARIRLIDNCSSTHCFMCVWLCWVFACLLVRDAPALLYGGVYYMWQCVLNSRSIHPVRDDNKMDAGGSCVLAARFNTHCTTCCAMCDVCV